MLSFLFLVLMVVGIKLNNLGMGTKSVSKTLNYIIIKPRQKINLNLFEAEKYEPAIIVQQLVGNLIYYSNFGRYETRLADSWNKTDDFTWSFKLKKKLKCENGEPINPDTFKKSLEKSILIFEKKGGIPILSSLSGYNQFISDNHNAKDINELKPILGIQATDDSLIFKFDKKIKSGFLQILSFSPFGYICSENFTANGEWRDDLKFISSGPYKVSKISVGSEYRLTKNLNWLDFSQDAPDEIVVSHDDTLIKKEEPTIIDAFTNEYTSSRLQPYKLVPEYINSVLIGNLADGYFKLRSTRVRFKNLFDTESAKILPLAFGVNTRSNTFYPNQQTQNIDDLEDGTSDLIVPTKPLLIEGTVPIEGTSRWHSWQVLKGTLDNLMFPYEFAGNESSFEQMTNKNYDFRIRGSSIGGGVEAWGLYVSFCSSMGINFPDPNGSICKLIQEYENDALSDEELSDQFLKTVNKEAAILPVSHYGVQLFLSDHLDTSSFSPLLAIMKFDKIRILK